MREREREIRYIRRRRREVGLWREKGKKRRWGKYSRGMEGGVSGRVQEEEKRAKRNNAGDEKMIGEESKEEEERGGNCRETGTKTGRWEGRVRRARRGGSPLAVWTGACEGPRSRRSAAAQQTQAGYSTG